MKKFLLKIILFTSPLFIFILFSFIFFLFKSQKIDAKMKRIAEEYECVLMGDSQIQRLKAEMFTPNTINLASSGEPYFFTYNKIKKLLNNEDSKIKKIILGVSAHNFGASYDRLCDVTLPVGKHMLKIHLYFFSLDNYSDFVNVHNFPVYELFSAIYYRTPAFGGEYESDKSHPTMEIINSIFENHYESLVRAKKNKYFQRKYLYKIDSICTQKNVDLILVSTPYHSEYKKKVPAEYYDFLNETIKKIPDSNYISFLSEETDPGLLSDANHLNKRGAVIYTDIINQKIKSKDNPDRYRKKQ